VAACAQRKYLYIAIVLFGIRRIFRVLFRHVGILSIFRHFTACSTGPQESVGPTDQPYRILTNIKTGRFQLEKDFTEPNAEFVLAKPLDRLP
jgi:hypothetical protein